MKGMVITMNESDFSNNLKLNGLKSTKHRLAILDILEKNSQPVSAEQLYMEMQKRDIAINLSTVYRILDTLCAKNLVIRLNIEGDNRTLFDFNRMVHQHHLICLECKKILAINRCPLEGYEKALAKETNYAIAGHKLDIYGYCPECQNKHTAGGL